MTGEISWSEACRLTEWLRSVLPEAPTWRVRQAEVALQPRWHIEEPNGHLTRAVSMWSLARRSCGWELRQCIRNGERQERFRPWQVLADDDLQNLLTRAGLPVRFAAAA